MTKIKLPINATRKRDEELEVEVSPDFLKPATKMIPDADEIRSGYVQALREMGSAKVNCQVEGLLKAHGSGADAVWVQRLARLRRCRGEVG